MKYCRSSDRPRGSYRRTEPDGRSVRQKVEWSQGESNGNRGSTTKRRKLRNLLIKETIRRNRWTRPAAKTSPKGPKRGEGQTGLTSVEAGEGGSRVAPAR